MQEKEREREEGGSAAVPSSSITSCLSIIIPLFNIWSCREREMTELIPHPPASSRKHLFAATNNITIDGTDGNVYIYLYYVL